MSRRAARVLLENLKSLGLEGRAELIIRDAEQALAELGASGRLFEGVFLDPPYGHGLAVRSLETIARSPLLARGAWVSVETADDEDLPARVGTLLRVRQDVYGDTRLTLYEVVVEMEH
jgi:16S rRNA G966 N2-methylase RsmD